MKSRHLIVFFAAMIALFLFFFRSPLYSYHSGLFAVNVLQEASGDCPDLDLHFSPDSMRPLRLQGTVSLFGERVPLEDPDVRERLGRELMVNTFWHSNALLHFQYANRFFPEVSRVLKEEGVPDDFKYLCLAESGFRDMVSPSQAVGYWQFLKETGKRYGLEIREDVDERYHLEKSTRAACAYLKEARDRLGNWTNAAASFNIGMQGIADRQNDQRVSSYYDMYLNQETSRYIFRILALKILFSKPQAAGYQIETEDLFQPYSYTTIAIDSSIAHIGDFARQHGLNYKQIKLLNPWLRSARLSNPDKKTYTIRLMK